ncbi:MAG: hypothetical protein Q8909_19055, partial [Bacteroidota bacterium]|nr:hypothetical protein [Bacteroidota bacterium]
MHLDYLEWDSAFFNKNIGRLIVHPNDTQNKITQTLEFSKNKYDLLYVFCPENYFLTEKDGLKLVDRKVVFAEDLLGKDYEPDSNIQPYIDAPNSHEDLTALAHISAKYSRFKTDS